LALFLLNFRREIFHFVANAAQVRLRAGGAPFSIVYNFILIMANTGMRTIGARNLRWRDVYFVAKQMGTSVRMIEEHYGHITPSKNADLILQGIPGWEPGKQSSATRSEVNVNTDGG
jgi:hypothetical protein